MDRLAGKIAIITGASQGMGEAHAPAPRDLVFLADPRFVPETSSGQAWNHISMGVLRGRVALTFASSAAKPPF